MDCVRLHGLSYQPVVNVSRSHVLQFLFGSASKAFTTMEKVLRQNVNGPVLHIPIFKRIRCCRVAYELS